MAELNQTESEKTESQGDGSASDGRTFTQKDLDRFLAEDRRKHQQQREEAAEKARREAEEKAALEKGEFQKLAEQRKSELESTATKAAALQAKLDAITAALQTQADARLAKLPKELRELAPEGLEAQDLLSWVAKAEANAEKLGERKDRSTPAGAQGSRRAPSDKDKDEDVLISNLSSNRYTF